MGLEILNEERLKHWCELVSVPQAGIGALIETARDIRENEKLERVFSEFHEATAIRGEWHREWSPLPVDPLAEQTFGERISLFYLLGYMAALPSAWQDYQRRGISEQVFRDTMRDIGFYYGEDSDIHGHWCFEHFPWIWRHLTGELFRLGRLQFMLAPFHRGIMAFRRRQNGQILLMANPDIDLREDGYADGAGGVSSNNKPWRAVLEERPEGWFGNPISPYGFALREPVVLPNTEWEVALRDGDIVLDIHIPRSTSLTEEECRDSFRQAYDFFAWQKPEESIHASFCHTWFFTPQLQQMLPPTSSIVRFQREFYLFPHPGGTGFLWTFVFGGKYPDPASAPRDTSLRRTVLDWLERGDTYFDLPGVRFHGPEDWGSQPYMSRWDKNGKLPD